MNFHIKFISHCNTTEWESLIFYYLVVYITNFIYYEKFHSASMQLMRTDLFDIVKIKFNVGYYPW